MTTDEARDVLYDIQDIVSEEEKYKQLKVLLEKIKLLKDNELEYDVRTELMDTMYHLYIDPAEDLSNFAWLLQYEEKSSSFYITQEVMWYYKWISTKLAENPKSSKERILSILEDMENRYQSRDLGEGPVFHEKKGVYILVGDKEKATEFFHKENEASSTDMDDCLACQIDSRLEYYSLMEDHEKLIKEAQPLLQRRHSCTHVPLVTYPKVVGSQISLGDWKEASRLTRLGFRQLDNDYTYVSSMIHHLRVFAYLGELPKAKEVAERVMPNVLQGKNYVDHFEFFASMEILVDILINAGENRWEFSQLNQNLMTEHGLAKNGLKEYKESLGTKARELGRAFDHRNETSAFMDRYKSYWKVLAEAPVKKD